MATTELDAATREALEGLKFENYIRHFRIEDRRSAQLVPFVLNPVQAKLRAIIDAKLEAGEPVRLIILKSRRMGVSTLIQATYAHLAFTTFRFTARTGAHHHAASSTLHKMTEQMWRFLPDPLRPEKLVGQQGRVLELATESELSTFTAKGGGGDGVGRSMAARAIHASEVAFWDDGAGTMAALKQIVPDEPGTFVIQESTAQGIGDYFHSECLRAMNGESAYEFVFFGWFEFPDYRRRVPAVGLGDLDAEEQALVANFDVDLEQLAWRRHTIANECSGSLDTFHEEYPATWQEAFQSSGRPYFRGLSEVPTPEPRYVGELDGIPVKGGNLKFARRLNGRIKIWEVWKPDRKYVIGADVAGSVVGPEYEARSVNEKADAYCAYVADVETGKTVACFHAQGITEKEYARELAALGSFYNKAEIAVEKAGGYGTATIIELRDTYRYYPMYQHLDDDSTERNDQTGAYGFPMSTITRPLVLAALDVLLREAPHCIVDAELVGEMRTFVTSTSGKLEADTGCHDDRVMARAITARLRDIRAAKALRIPLTPEQKRKRELGEALRMQRVASPIMRRAPRIR